MKLSHLVYGCAGMTILTVSCSNYKDPMQIKSNIPSAAIHQETAQAMSLGVESDDFQIRMIAEDSQGNSLPLNIPVYFTAAPGVLSGEVVAKPVVAKRHNGKNVVVFNKSELLNTTPYFGIYIPAGYDAYYKILPGRDSISPVVNKGWIPYAADKQYVQNTAPGPLQLGLNEFPALSLGTAFKIRWLIKKNENYTGNTLNLYESLTVIPSGKPTAIALGMITKNMEGQASGADGGGISVAVSEPLGGIITDLKIKTGSRDYISILHNGAITDDGINFGIHINGAEGILPNSASMGSSQFCGHPGSKSIFTASTWGMEVPLKLTKSPDSLHQELNIDSSRCGSEACLIPMYSDFIGYDFPGDDKSNDTLPFIMPSSLHPWDGRVSKIALNDRKDEVGTNIGVKSLELAFEYKPHMNFKVVDEFLPHLWFNQHVKTKQPFDVYLVTKDDNYIKLPSKVLTTFIDSDTVESEANAEWSKFCPSKPSRPRCTNEKSKNNGGYQCLCVIRSDSNIKRVIYDYTDSNVALAIDSSNGVFEKFIFSINYRQNTPLGLISSIMNNPMNTSMSFNSNDPLRSEKYLFNVGTLSNLKKMQ